MVRLRMMRGKVSLPRTGWLLIMVIALLRAQPLHTDSLQLQRYLTNAAAHNPSIVAARALSEAKKRDIALAFALPDPTITTGYFLNSVETRVGPQRAKIGASQMIPWPGKLLAKKEIAQKEYAAALEVLREVEARVFSEVRGGYADYYALGREIAITHESMELLKNIESVLVTRYSTAEALPVALLKVQVEMALLDEKQISLDADIVKEREVLRALLGSKGSTALPIPIVLGVLSVPESADTLWLQIEKRNPALLRAGYESDAAAASVTLARQGFGPDIMLSTDYIVTDKSSSSMVSSAENGKNGWVAGAGISLPLWVGSKRSQIERAQATAVAKDASVSAVTYAARAEATAACENYRDACRKVALYAGTLVAQSRQTLALVEESYINGKSTIVDYLDAQRMLLQLQVTLTKQRARRETFAGKIDQLLGGDLSRRELQQ